MLHLSHFSHQVSLLNLKVREVLPLPQFDKTSSNLEFDRKPPGPVLPRRPRGRPSAFSGVCAGVDRVLHIPVSCLSDQEHHRPFPPCPSHATSRTCATVSPSQSRRNDCWLVGKPPSFCPTSVHHVPDSPARAGELPRGAGSATDVANCWGSKGVRPALSALV